MKIERINENQIRCTLTRADLQQRQIKLSELAYGTGKAQALFSEMIRFASSKFGFEVDDSPLMVEAIPISSDAIVLIVTKVAFPEELDTRFSNFSRSPLDGQSPYYDDYEGSDLWLDPEGHSASEILEASQEVSEPADSQEVHIDGDAYSQPISEDRDSLTRIFAFDSIDDLFDLSHVLLGYIKADNTLYHIKGDAYYLILHGKGQTPAQYNKICNVVSEYGRHCALPGGAEHYFGEHRRPVLRHNALQSLAVI